MTDADAVALGPENFLQRLELTLRQEKGGQQERMETGQLQLGCTTFVFKGRQGQLGSFKSSEETSAEM